MAHHNPKYESQLADPRWRKKRLKILSRDGWRCVACGDGADEAASPLHVHHSYYVKNRELWHYPDWSLRTLCVVCHANIHQLNADEFSGFELLLDLLCESPDEAYNLFTKVEDAMCERQLERNTLYEMAGHAFLAPSPHPFPEQTQTQHQNQTQSSTFFSYTVTPDGYIHEKASK